MKIGLVLSGGFARGAAQQGFLKAICEKIGRNSISIVSSSSIGCINSLALSANHMDKLEDIYKSIGFKSLKDVKNKLKHNLLKNVINELLTDDYKLDIPFYVTGTCVNNISTHYFLINQQTSIEQIKTLLDISITFPLVNGIVKKRFNKFYMDGGATDNIPVAPFLINKVDILLILHCYSSYLPPKEIIDSTKVVIDVDVTSRCKNVSSFSLSHKNLSYMYDQGYEYGKLFSEQVFCDNDLEKIKERGQKFIRDESAIRKKNKPTFFSLVSILNKIHCSRGFIISDDTLDVEIK